MKPLRVKSAARALAILSRFRLDNPALTWKRQDEDGAYAVLEPQDDGTKSVALRLEVIRK